MLPHSQAPCQGLALLSSFAFTILVSLLVTTPKEVVAKEAGFDVQVDLVGNWPAVGKRAQAIEWTKRLGSSQTRSALERLAKGDAEVWKADAGNSLPGAFFDTVAANGLFAPAVEAQRASCRALARKAPESTCASAVEFAVVGGQVVCNLETLQSELKKAAPGVATRLSGDAIAYMGDGALAHPGQTVIICGCTEEEPPQPRTLLSWALTLSDTQGKNPLYQSLTVVFRQADCGGTLPPERLSGYGVELRVKSTEYKATVEDAETNTTNTTDKEASEAVEEDDDSNVESDATTALEGALVSGLKLDRLAKRFPALAPSLLRFRDQTEGEGLSEDLKRWEIVDLGYQAAARIRKSPDPLSTLETLTGNFPGLMAALARDKVRPSLRKAAKSLSAGAQGQSGIQIDSGAVSDKGFTLLDVMRYAEPWFVAMARLGPDADRAVSHLQAADRSVSASENTLPQRLDWRDPSLKWVYHVRDDDRADEWSTRISSLTADHRGLKQDKAPDGTTRLGIPKEKYEAMQNGGGVQLEVQQPAFTIVFAFNPADVESLKLAVAMSQATRAMRLALVPVSDPTLPENVQEASQAVACAFGSLLKSGKRADAAKARAFLFAFLELSQNTTAGTSAEVIGAAMRQATARKGKETTSSKAEDTRVALQAIADGQEAYQAFEKYVAVKNLPVPCMTVNGIMIKPKGGKKPFSMKSFTKQLAGVIGEEFAFLALGVEEKKLLDHKKAADNDKALEEFTLLEGDSVAVFDKTLTPDVVYSLPKETIAKDDLKSIKERVVGIGQVASAKRTDAPAAAQPTTDPRRTELKAMNLPSDALATAPSFVSSDASGDIQLDFVLFLTRLEAATLVPAFASRLLSKKGARLLVISAPSFSRTDPKGFEVIQSCLAAAESLDDLAYPEVSWPPAARCEGGKKLPSQLAAAKSLWEALPQDLANLAASGAAGVCNGRLVPDMPILNPKSTASLVEKHWCPKAIPGFPAGLTAAAAAVRPQVQSENFLKCDIATPKALRIRLPRRNPAAPASLQLAAVIDPLWEGSTSFAALARLLHAELNAEICIILNPSRQVQEYPLKRWARHVIARPSSSSTGPVALFERLQTRHTLTLAMVSPPSWLVSARESQHDLDNIRRRDAIVVAGPRPEVTATYELERLYIEGTAYMQSGEPAAGLQLELVSPDQTVGDTRVMKNLGFWSMPALPGHYELRLKDGPSNETFQFMSDDVTTDSSRLLEVTSFDATVLPLKVQARDGKREKDLYKKTYGKKKTWKQRQRHKAQEEGVAGGAQNATSGPLPTVHIFSVASGHLYERLLAIMIQSVRRHTEAPLHFWFIDNFLSPEFKEVLLPALVQKHGRGKTSYDLVSFKWPSWLNQQTEKQRLIWAYKILFLDVLFPMDVSRVIFIDADQVVRADVLELWNMDLQDSVYAFTPFCNGVVPVLGDYVVNPADGLSIRSDQDLKSKIAARVEKGDKVNVLEIASKPVGKKGEIRARIESPAGWITVSNAKGKEFATPQTPGPARANSKTTGFRFWEKGYWKGILQERQYHISALFVVDLDEFRRKSVGDVLRYEYNELTADPNALANLDQDLPNYAQTKGIRIHSLPQDWLWCESWCSEASKPLAKTIDLCQNPLTKESKISMALRIIPEWEGYHKEVLALSTALTDGGTVPLTAQSKEAPATKAPSTEAPATKATATEVPSKAASDEL